MSHVINKRLPDKHIKRVCQIILQLSENTYQKKLVKNFVVYKSSFDYVAAHFYTHKVGQSPLCLSLHHIELEPCQRWNQIFTPTLEDQHLTTIFLIKTWKFLLVCIEKKTTFTFPWYVFILRKFSLFSGKKLQDLLWSNPISKVVFSESQFNSTKKQMLFV